MLMLVSPAKSLDFDTPATTKTHTQPEFIERSAALIKQLKKLNPEDIQELMGVSHKIADLNYQRFQNWHPEFDLDNAKQSAFAFQGDVYQGLEIDQFDAARLKFAQKHLRILSGLYGLLRPLDLMQAYRLEMGTKFKNQQGANLYEFWGEDITQTINSHQKKIKSTVLLNLASNEYFKAVKPKLLNAEVITPVFKDFKNDKYKIISFYAKKARGMMAAYVIENKITEAEQIKQFNTAGYKYSAAESTKNEWVFLRQNS